MRRVILSLFIAVGSLTLFAQSDRAVPRFMVKKAADTTKVNQKVIWVEYVLHIGNKKFRNGDTIDKADLVTVGTQNIQLLNPPYAVPSYQSIVAYHWALILNSNKGQIWKSEYHSVPVAMGLNSPPPKFTFNDILKKAQSGDVLMIGSFEFDAGFARKDGELPTQFTFYIK